MNTMDRTITQGLALEDTHSSGEEDFDVDSLFDSATQTVAPSIPGLYFDPSVLISEAMSSHLITHTHHYFHSKCPTKAGHVNQAMLFGRASEQNSGLPPFLDDLIMALTPLLKPHLPAAIHEMLFAHTMLDISQESTRSRQAILNHYAPGEGITPHVDLLQRFADGIIGVSLGSGTVMSFRRVLNDGEEPKESDQHDLYLPARSIIVLTRDARYKWTHGIDGRYGDYILGQGEKSWIERGTRVSITLRWLLPGADLVGGE
ncbi:hypothetical protein BU17DRAFT_77913 [Hysterangium stoloniferum]|nr:hypothetical protein BU17DRAFT_77913 [Hysterangium stoloniferum]